jgi:peptidoglycan/xylan/chitin deacetylase (PgdA/CDA1 family)
MRLLAEQRSCMPLTDLVSGISEDRLPSHGVCITFDDGYSDNLLRAKSILREFSLPATFFLTSGYLKGQADFWWDALETPFFQKVRIPPTLQIQVDSALLTFDFSGDTEYRESAFADHRRWRAWDPPLSKRHSAYHRLWQAFHRIPSATRDGLIDAIHDWGKSGCAAGPSSCRPLTASEVRELASGPGIDIGGHTVTHPALPVLDRQAQEREIVENKRQLEDLLGRRLRLFSYPHGECSDETVALLKEAGYVAAFTTQGSVVERSADLFRLPRIAVEDWSAEEFADRLRNQFIEP